MTRKKIIKIIPILYVLLIYVSVVKAQTLHLEDIGFEYQWLINYKTVDGTQLDLHIFKPYGHKPTDRRPAVVFIHGGGFVSGKPSYFSPHCRYFASRGLIAFSINYRLVEKKGLDAFDAVGDCLTDCKSAVRYIRSNAEKYGIDLNCIAVAGDSAGGHLAACLGTIHDFDDPGEDQSISSMANAIVLYNAVIDMNLPVFKNLFQIKETGPAVKERADRISPINYVTPNQPPALVMHGTEDKVVPIEYSNRFTEAMKKAGNRCDMIALEGINHAFVIVGIGTEETIVTALQATDRFLVSLGYIEGEPTIEVSEKQ